MRIIKKCSNLLLAIMTLVMFSQCNKDRVEVEKNEYSSMNDYFNSKKQEEQDFLIDTLGSCPVTGNQGTRVCPIKTNIQKSSGDSVYFPFYMHLIELYTPKDLIYYQLSNFGESSVVSNVGVIRLRATKDNDDLTMRTNGTWDVEKPNDAPVSGKKIYYSNEGSNWATSNEGYTTTTYGYDGDVSQLSWTSCASDPNLTGSTVKYTFTSEVDNLENVVIYVYLPDLESLVMVSDQESIGLPVGQKAKVILMAINSSGDLYHYYDETTISSAKEYDIKLSEISDDDLTDILDKL